MSCPLPFQSTQSCHHIFHSISFFVNSYVVSQAYSQHYSIALHVVRSLFSDLMVRTSFLCHMSPRDFLNIFLFSTAAQVLRILRPISAIWFSVPNYIRWFKYTYSVDCDIDTSTLSRNVIFVLPTLIFSSIFLETAFHLIANWQAWCYMRIRGGVIVFWVG